MPYIIIFSCVFILGVFDYISFNQYPIIVLGKHRYRIDFFYWLILALLLLAAWFRNPYWGPDSINYSGAYAAAARGNISSYEYGYILLQKLCVMFQLDYQGFTRVIAILMYPLLFLAYGKRNERSLLILSYVAMNYFDSFAIHRNYIACTFMLLAYDSYIEKKYKTACIFVIVACLFHNTTFIYIFLLLMSRKERGKKYWVSLVIIAAIIYISDIYRIIFYLLGLINGRYLAYLAGLMDGAVPSRGSTIYTILLLLALILSVLYQSRIDNSECRILQNFLCYIAVFTIFFPWFPNYSRVIRVSFVLIAILVSETIHVMKQTNRRITVFMYSLILFVAMYFNQGFFLMEGMFSK
ncbi:MAG: EpsG family protein [Lachnospiraceae bacterium]|nr:EpsG family protein [Lachnospiraceae bacterium]